MVRLGRAGGGAPPRPWADLERRLENKDHFIVSPQMERGEVRRRARRLARSAPIVSDGEWANATVGGLGAARVRYLLDAVTGAATRIHELVGEHHRLTAAAERVTRRLGVAEDAYRDEEERTRRRLIADQAAAAAAKVPTSATGEPAVSIGWLLVVALIFAGEFVLSRSAAQLFGLSGYTLDLFALGLTAGLFAGCRVVADLLRRLGGGRRVVAMVAVVAFLAVIVTAVNLALLRTAYTEAVFSTTAGRRFTVDVEVLHAVGWVGVALLAVLMAIDYGTPPVRPAWGRLIGSAATFVTRWRARRALRRFDENAYGTARAERANRQSQVEALHEQTLLVRRDLHRLVGELDGHVEDLKWACRQQNDANAMMRHNYAQEYSRAHVPWRERLRARWRGSQLDPVTLPGSALVPLDVEEVLTSARRIAAHSIDELQGLGILRVQEAEGGGDGEAASDVRGPAEAVPAQDGGQPVRATTTLPPAARLNGAHA